MKEKIKKLGSWVINRFLITGLTAEGDWYIFAVKWRNVSIALIAILVIVLYFSIGSDVETWSGNAYWRK